MIRSIATFIALFVVTQLGTAAVPFLNPEQAIAKMTKPDGFNVNAYAAEPDVVQPFSFVFDDRGRTWVLENLNYETRSSDTFDQGPKGRITILEDTDGDGTADTRKVFADKIFFPTGLALGFGGVWVGSPPNLLFFPDRNGDDIPDSKPEVILDGWGRNDRHETLNSFTWGPDGWLYGLHGVFTHSRVGRPGTPDEERQPINAGVWRLHPTTKQFEVFAWGTSNPWGLDFNANGQIFLTACVIPHLWHIQQGGRYQRQAGRHFNEFVYDDIKTAADHRHKSAHGGARFYLADKFPKKYQNRLFMCNIHDHAVLTDIIEPKGSGYVGKHGDTFLDSHDPQWLGFNMELGPDGAIYIIDWHDDDICGRKVVHEQTGRIWRIAYGDSSLSKFDLTKRSDAELVRLQTHANNWYVRQARRLLQERSVLGKLSPTVAPALQQLFKSGSTTQLKLQALWALKVTGNTSDNFLTSLLSHEDEFVRAWAIQLLAEDKSVTAAVLNQWAAMAKTDPSPVVRLYLASAMQRVSIDQRWDVLTGLVSHAEDKDDQNLPLLIWYALEPGIQADRARALKLAPSIKIPRIASFLARRLTARTSQPAKVKPVKAKPSKEVSRDEMLVWYQANGLTSDKDGDVSIWSDGLRNGRHARQSNPAARPTSVAKIGGRPALRFDGVNDHLILPHDKELSFKATDSYSSSVWVYFEGKQNGWRTVFAKSRDKSPWYGTWINPEGEWVFGNAEANLSASKAKKGWHHIALVQDGKKEERRIYVDGFLIARDQSQDADGSGALWIGGSANTKEFLKGAISELRIYGRALSAAEVSKLSE